LAGTIFFSSHDGGRTAGKSSSFGKLLALANLCGELDHYNHGKFLLCLRGTKFTGEQCLFLRLTCLDETAADGLSAIPP